MQWLQTGEYVDVKAGSATRRIFVRSSGSGDEVLLFLHGFPTSSWDWHKIEPLLRGRSLLFFDFLGFGASEKPADHRYDLMEQASIAQTVVQHFGLKSLRLVAHDYGSSVAQELLARHAEGTLDFDLTDVTLLNGGIYPDLHRPVFLQKLLRSPLGPLAARAANETATMRALAAVFSRDHQPTAEELHEHWLAIERNGGAQLGHRLIRYIDDRLAHEKRWVEALENARVPLRFVWGMRDPVSGAHVMDRLRERFDGRARLITLDDVGHYPQLEAPERVAAAIGTA